MIIDCIADLHGHYPKLEGGDLLIVAGDLTARDSAEEYFKFMIWLAKTSYRKRIVIAGNHDNWIQTHPEYIRLFSDYEYLCDSGTEFEGLKIWGSPWTSSFEGMNPDCTAFTMNYGCDTDDWLAEKWELIPYDTDILITHGPPRGVLDCNIYKENCGSLSLLNKANSLPNLKLFVFGHIHESYGMLNMREFDDAIGHLFPAPKCKSFPIIVNASHVNEQYQPVNKPVRILF